MIKLHNTVAIIAILASLSACGNQPGERALSGGGIGAGVGAVGSAVLGANPVTGALIGGAVGAATGGLTKEKDIDLGKPIWK
jgi:osmotically inducible lipoprotein OsmB